MFANWFISVIIWNILGSNIRMEWADKQNMIFIVNLLRIAKVTYTFMVRNVIVPAQVDFKIKHKCHKTFLCFLHSTQLN